MKKYFYQIVILAIVIATLAISYYFFWLIPNQILQQKIEKCHDLRNEIINEDPKIRKDFLEVWYSKKADACLYSYFTQEDFGEAYFVRNAYTRVEILRYERSDEKTSKCNVCVDSLEEFEKEKKQTID